MGTAELDSTRVRAIRAAQGQEPFDILLANGTVLDTATSELRHADVGLVGDLISSVHPCGSRNDAARTVDCTGCILTPGFIDIHVHFESSHMTPARYASVVVPQGTTTIFYDPHELANALGLDGVRYAIEASRNLPLRFICAAPSSVPSAPGLEMSAADFAGEEMEEMLAWPEVAGVAEAMDMNGILSLSRRMSEILEAGLRSGKLIEGHGRGLTGARLQGYAASGVSSDHELTSGEDALEKLRAGLTIEVRGSHDYVLPGIVEVVNQLPQVPSTMTVCTDDVPPDFLVEKGGMVDVLRRLIGYGMDPVQAIRCATLNAAIRLRRGDLGMLAPGRTADIVVLSDLPSVTVDRVFCGGRLAAQGGEMVIPVEAPAAAVPGGRTSLTPFTLDDCRISVPGVRNGRAVIRTIKGARFAVWSQVEVDVREGFADLAPGYGVILVRHRHGRHAAPVQRAVLEDWGEPRGAVATTYSHDSHNLVAIGRRPEDLQAAANAVAASGGGMAVARDGQITAMIEMPIAGMLSDELPARIAEAYRRVREAAGEVIEWKPPYRTFKALEGTALACNAGPHLTDLGLTDGTSGEIVDLLIELKS
ncbi:MAG TPA: adenine deaminase C-terminal domain-containing protein [Candidatus Acidoferrales bacterium]|nr:adenine deaminase C-terminal domain-containing protein [Candidatus Acidoferrales bacterium]